jgi:hypothetical protein
MFVAEQLMQNKEGGLVVLDCENLKTKLAEVKADIESVEIAYNNNSMQLENIASDWKMLNL